MRSVTRRKLLKTLLVLGAGGVFSALPCAGSIVFAGDGKPSPETFAAVCAFVTLQDKLDAGVMAKMYKVFMDEPWGPEHTAGLYAKITAALDGKKRPPLKDKSWRFTEGEAWFAGHLLTTWYLGVYYHESRPPLRLAYEQALMFAPLQGVIPVPFVEAIPYGSWAEKPS